MNPTNLPIRKKILLFELIAPTASTESGHKSCTHKNRDAFFNFFKKIAGRAEVTGESWKTNIISNFFLQNNGPKILALTK